MLESVRAMSLGWKLLLLSGLLFLMIGAFLSLAWNPSSGPYELGRRYPFGGFAEALLVSNGFSFLGFGTMFLMFTGLTYRLRDKRSWLTIMIAWSLTMFPHILIGVAFLVDNPSTLFSVLPLTLLTLVWAGSGVLGLVLSGRETLRKTGL